MTAVAPRPLSKQRAEQRLLEAGRRVEQLQRRLERAQQELAAAEVRYREVTGMRWVEGEGWVAPEVRP